MISRRIAFTVQHASNRSYLLHPSGGWLQWLAAKQHWRSFADIVVKVPQMAESISEGTLKQLSKGVGDRVSQDEEIATIETDKACIPPSKHPYVMIDVAVNAPESGIIREIFVQEEDNVVVGQDLARIELGESTSATEKNELATEHNADGENKSLTPPKDKESDSKHPIESASVREAQSQEHSRGPTMQTSKSSGTDFPAHHNPAPVYSGSSNREERRLSSNVAYEMSQVKMNRMRLRIAERLKQSQNTAASLTTFNEVDMSNIIEFRRLYLDETLKKTGVKLGFMGAFSRAAVQAMRDLPAVNASIEGSNGGDTIVYRDYVDISVAVATEKGLVTPVVRNVESLDMIGVERAIAEMGKKARDGKLSIEDMAGGTFTISNGGIFGSLMGTPIINLPQSAVLGLHAIKERPVAVNGEVKIRPMMYVALTYDHRLLDGREAVQFLVKVKQCIEDPRRMLL
ncbi:hypothetical protein CP533_3210 [Ophiocordyceps camponoti-saundersi (nom. inval.)]|nr:hypothetical protein CP533_3210 [Ophiocordyceps camponoti-saundersi (nom. inval.)]